jgi:hypothetical protein
VTSADHRTTGVVEYQIPLRTVALSAAFFAVMTALFAYFAIAGHGPAIAAAAVGAVLFGRLFVRIIVRAALRRPAVVLSDEGMRFQSGSHVSWDEVASVAVFPGTSGVAWKGFIGVELRDPEAYLGRISYNHRRHARAGIARGFGPIRMQAEAFPVPMDEVVATMSRFHPGLVVHA